VRWKNVELWAIVSGLNFDCRGVGLPVYLCVVAVGLAVCLPVRQVTLECLEEWGGSYLKAVQISLMPYSVRYSPRAYPRLFGALRALAASSRAVRVKLERLT
jgi:hypothetical protein